VVYTRKGGGSSHPQTIDKHSIQNSSPTKSLANRNLNRALVQLHSHEILEHGRLYDNPTNTAAVVKIASDVQLSNNDAAPESSPVAVNT